MLDLHARTPAGHRLVAIAERAAATLAADAAEHDRDGTFPHHHVTALADGGYLAAPVPHELGGGGVDSVHDLLVAASRLARGHASIAIGASMHLIPLVHTAQRWRMARAAGETRRADVLGDALAAMIRNRAVIATAVSEPGGGLTRPATRARPDADGWIIDGRKAMCTLAPSATLLYTAVTFPGPDGEERHGYARVPATALGVTVHDDWDGLGMRASGSHSVSFDGVRIPRHALGGGVPAGRISPGFLERSLVSGAFHAAASLGIAEAAHMAAAAGLARRNGSVSGLARVRTLAAENAIELTAIRSALRCAGDRIDARHAAACGTGVGAEQEDIVDVFAELQAAKAFVLEAATRIVDRSLALAGPAAYRSDHPVARAVRDVRAGQFMNPLAATRAYEFLADRVLGLEPTLA